MTSDKNTKHVAETAPHCAHAPCPCTQGYYLGGGRYVCWAHLLALYGKAAVVVTKTSPPVGLEATQ